MNNSCCVPSREAKATLVPTISPQGAPLDFDLDLTTLQNGAFWMGEDRSGVARPQDGEGPVRQVEVGPFQMGKTTVTNAQFAAFIESTGYVTEAESFGWSYVFHRHVNAENRRRTRGVAGGAQWWFGVEGADWRHPEGPGSNLRKRENHPITHVSWNDANAFCTWAGCRLPREEEWEYAARGGLERKIFPWGDDLVPKDKKGRPQHQMNVWQGKFPDLDTGVDGFTATAPAKFYLPNGFGLFQMTGNVWQWCQEWFNPQQTRVLRGGSFLCHASYCNRYRCASRTGNSSDSTSSHGGFRVVRDL